MPIDISNKEQLDVPLTGTQMKEAIVQAHLSKDAIAKIEGLEASASEIDGSVNLAHSSLNSFLFQINDNSRHMSIFVNSDSTGNANNEWVYYFAEWLAETYPEYTVRYRLWNDTTNVYEAPISINVGTGSYNIDIFNFAVSGSQVFHCLNEDRKTEAFLNITDTSIYTDSSSVVDLCIINHGHNVFGAPNNWSNSLRYAYFTEQFILAHPFSSYLLIRQNPRRDDLTNKPYIQSAVDWAKYKQFAIANVWDKFMALNRDVSLYADNIHPSTGLGTEIAPTGTRLFLDAIKEQLTKKFNYNFKMFKSLLAEGAFSYCANSDLLHNDGDAVVPTGFTLSGCTAAKDTSTYNDPKKGYSTKLTAAVTGQSHITYSLGTAQRRPLLGKLITVCALVKTNTSTSTSYGRLGINQSTSSVTDSVLIPLNGGWHWVYVSTVVNPTTTYFQARFFLESSTGSIGNTINIDKLFIIEGAIPAGAAI